MFASLYIRRLNELPRQHVCFFIPRYFNKVSKEHVCLYIKGLPATCLPPYTHVTLMRSPSSMFASLYTRYLNEVSKELVCLFVKGLPATCLPPYTHVTLMRSPSNMFASLYARYLNEVSKQHVCLLIHLLHFLKLIRQTQAECLELYVSVLATWDLTLVDIGITRLHGGRALKWGIQATGLLPESGVLRHHTQGDTW